MNVEEREKKEWRWKEETRESKEERVKRGMRCIRGQPIAIIATQHRLARTRAFFYCEKHDRYVREYLQEIIFLIQYEQCIFF